MTGHRFFASLPTDCFSALAIHMNSTFTKLTGWIFLTASIFFLLMVIEVATSRLSLGGGFFSIGEVSLIALGMLWWALVFVMALYLLNRLPNHSGLCCVLSGLVLIGVILGRFGNLGGEFAVLDSSTVPADPILFCVAALPPFVMIVVGYWRVSATQTKAKTLPEIADENEW